jgi:hypothetical protein
LRTPASLQRTSQAKELTGERITFAKTLLQHPHHNNASLTTLLRDVKGMSNIACNLSYQTRRNALLATRCSCL